MDASETKRRQSKTTSSFTSRDRWRGEVNEIVSEERLHRGSWIFTVVIETRIVAECAERVTDRDTDRLLIEFKGEAAGGCCLRVVSVCTVVVFCSLHYAPSFSRHFASLSLTRGEVVHFRIDQ